MSPKKDFLSTALLDYVIKLTTLVPDSSSFIEPGVQPLLGILGAEAFICSMNLTASIKKEQSITKNDWKAYQGHICKACTNSRIYSNTMSRMAISRIFSKPTSRMAMSHSG
jgi:hypothetical protein